jgi:hypothetical protein
MGERGSIVGNNLYELMCMLMDKFDFVDGKWLFSNDFESVDVSEETSELLDEIEQALQDEPIIEADELDGV